MRGVYPDEAAAEIAARQHSLITVSQAASVGLGRKSVRYRLERGRWRVARRGVLAVAGGRPTWEQAVMAAVLGAGATAHASHQTAARLWGMPVPDGDEIEITTVLERHARLPGVRSHRSGLLVEADSRIVDGIPTLSAVRTVVDLSTRLDELTLGRAFDAAWRRGSASPLGLRRCLDRLPLAPGRSPSRLERLLAKRVPSSAPDDSVLETDVFEAIVDAGLPQPALQHRVRIGDRTYKIDLAYPELKIAIEVDGFGPHGTRVAFDDDRRRQNDLVAAGWTVLRFTSDFSVHEIVSAVSAAFGQKGAA
jgi:very-short-patch-repair endonuclease